MVKTDLEIDAEVASCDEKKYLSKNETSNVYHDGEGARVNHETKIGETLRRPTFDAGVEVAVQPGSTGESLHFSAEDAKMCISHLNTATKKKVFGERLVGIDKKEASHQDPGAKMSKFLQSNLVVGAADSFDSKVVPSGENAKQSLEESETVSNGAASDFVSADSSNDVIKPDLDAHNKAPLISANGKPEGLSSDEGLQSRNRESVPTNKEVFRSPVAEFYNDRSILITGATGFMGKVLVQRLLVNCPGIDKIYLLIRPKRDCLPEDRLSSLLSVPIFAEIAASSLKKVVAIQGDITEPALGISKQDEKTLINSVSVIFHSAATVKFDDDLTKSVQMNIEGTRMVVDLARKMPHLKALVHTSTAYSHCYNKDISEKFYPCTSTTPEAIIKLCNGSGSNTDSFQKALNHPLVTKEIIGHHPNTYTFTKALAEQLLFENASDLPLAIVRPSIVVAAWKDPLPGWVDNLNGPTGMITGASSGILRSIMVTPDNIADIVPVDVAINLMCVVASRLGSKSINNNNSIEGDSDKNVIPIYNCTSGSTNPITWKGIMDKIIPGITKYPLEQMAWFPTLKYQTNPWVHKMSHLLMHRMPAFLVDSGLKLLGRPPFMGKIITRLEKATEALEFFSTRQWQWSTKAMQELEKSMQPGDRAIFGIDIKDLNWDSYMESYAYGTRHYVMKGDPSTVEASVRKGKFLLKAHQALVFSLAFGLLMLIGLVDPFDLPGKFFFACVLSWLFTTWIIDFRFE